MKSILLYFGSFNPIHNGHVAIARWAAKHVVIDEVWLVVSPQNPLRNDLAPQEDRLNMARLTDLTVSDVEFGLPKPSYTIDTLRFLSKEHPDCRFSLLAGGDIVEQLPRWKDYEELLAEYHIYIYPREGSVIQPPQNITILENAPQLDFSSTDVRHALENGDDISDMVPEKVAEYIESHGLWRPATAAGWLARGRRAQREGRMSAALSDLLRAADMDPSNPEITQRITMLREIFAYHYTDYYNP